MEWGCNADAIIPMMLDGETIMRCPRRPFLDNPLWYNEVFTSYKWAQKGHLTEAGTWLDQGAMLSSAFEVLDVAIADAKKKQESGNAARERTTQGGGPPSGPQNAQGANMSQRPGR